MSGPARQHLLQWTEGLRDPVPKLGGDSCLIRAESRFQRIEHRPALVISPGLLVLSSRSPDIVAMDQPTNVVALRASERPRRRMSVATILALSFAALVLVSVGSVLTLTVGANYRNTFDLIGKRETILGLQSTAYISRLAAENEAKIQDFTPKKQQQRQHCQEHEAHFRKRIEYDQHLALNEVHTLEIDEREKARSAPRTRYLDIEEVKRFTGLGTGPCQGKECQLHTCRLLQVERLKHPERTAQQPEAPQTDHPFTTRPPVYSVPLGVLARSGSASPHAPQAPAASKRKP